MCVHVQGVQAQTVANYRLAVDANLTVIPVLNKIDLKQANVEQVTKQLVNLFNVNPNDVIEVCFKYSICCCCCCCCWWWWWCVCVCVYLFACECVFVCM